MDTNDFLGSFAQEDVLFQTTVVRQKRVGDNYWKVMIFVENSRFVTVDSVWSSVPGSSKAKALVVTANDYADHTTGLLRSWLYDLFCNGFMGDCILVACGIDIVASTVYVYSSDGTTFYSDAEMAQSVTIPTGKTPTPTDVEHQYSYETDADPTAFITAMEEAYGLLKAYAYHKTVCAGTDTAIIPAVGVRLAQLCEEDKEYLSMAPYFPFSTPTPTTPDSDPLYTAIIAAKTDAFMSAHQDITRNGALYSLGIALATLNSSRTCVGSSLDMAKSLNITSSGPNGSNLPKPVRDMLNSIHIQSFKPVGNNTGAVTAKGAETLKGHVVPAVWIVAYVTYMTKVRVAELMTVPNFLQNASNYSRIVGVMGGILALFGTQGSGRIDPMNIIAPAYGNLPDASGDEIIIPEAWEGWYVDSVRKVRIAGSLYIGV